MKKINLTSAEAINGGDQACTNTIDFLWSFSGACFSTLTPMGLGLGIGVGAVTLALHAMGACQS